MAATALASQAGSGPPKGPVNRANTAPVPVQAKDINP
jgi:hypothetical protein